MSSTRIDEHVGRIRKDHECRVCGEIIKKGSECYIYRGVEDGAGFYSIYFHFECREYSYDWVECDWETMLPGSISRDEIREEMGDTE